MKSAAIWRIMHFPSLAAIVIAICVGCGDSGPPRVSGTVTLNGLPVKLGEIQFAPTDGVGKVASAVITEGAYSVEATPGAKRVEIQAFEKVGEKPMDPSMPGSAMAPIMKPLLPEKYNTASELTLEVQGSTEKDFDLTTP